jgi:hypothetical protein
MPNQQASSSFSDESMNLPTQQHSDETPAELENNHAQHHETSLNDNQHHDNNQDIADGLNNQHQPSESSLNNDQQQLTDNPSLDQHIQDLQISDTIVPVQYPIDNTRHYTTFFYQQSDFKDYAHPDIQPRMPKLYTGKRYIS